MKKKSVRKVSSAKKVISKSPNKKIKFSLKAWLLGGVVILIALAYSYSNSLPKSYKVIELSGKVEDYIKPAPVDINLINNTVKGPISDTPEANAIAAAAQAKKNAIAAGKTVEQANQSAKTAASQAVKQTYQANAAAGVMTNADAQKALTVKEKSADGTEKTEAEKAAEYATNYVQNNISIVPKTDETTGTTSYSVQIQPNYGSQVNTEGQCETSNGGSVYAGSTVIGSSDRVYRCTSTGWQATDTYCVASKMDIKDCPVSVKPSYALPSGKANCYSGSVIIGQDQIVDTKDGKRVCDNGALIQPKKINGQIVTPEKYDEIFKDQQNKCVNNGGSWTQTGDNTGEYYCGKGNSKTCSGIGKVFSETTQGCVEPGSAGDKADSKKTTPYSKAGCDNARDRNKEDCIQSADNPLLWVIVPKGTKPSINSGVPVKVSSEVNAGNTNYNGSKECENALKLKGSGYSCEPIAGGNYYKLTPLSQLPAPQREFVADAQGNFGNTANSNSENNNVNQNNTDSNTGNSNLDAANKGREAGEKAAKNKKNLTEWCIRDAECGTGYCDNSAFFWNWQCKTDTRQPYPGYNQTSETFTDWATRNKDAGNPYAPKTDETFTDWATRNKSNNSPYAPKTDETFSEWVSRNANSSNSPYQQMAKNAAENSNNTQSSDSKTPTRYNPAAGQPSNTSAGKTTTFNVVDWIKSWFAPSNNKEIVSQTDKLKDNAEGRQCYLASEGDDACSKCPDVVGEELDYGYDSNRPNSFAATFCLK